MTENEIIETHIAENIHRIEVIERFIHSNPSADKEKCEKNKKVLTSVNGLLQEIQQYRTIGTVEDIKKGIKQSEEEFDMLMKYSSIGTIEEFKALKEKSTAKKPNQVSRVTDKDKFVGLIGRCPNCSSIVAEDNLVCEDCFQVLDWSE